MKPTREPIERVWFDEQPVKDNSMKRFILGVLAIGIVIIYVGYRWDGTW